jgi:lipoate-protein ligase A
MELSLKTLSSDIANVAFDEALLELAERQPEHPEVLRLWQPQNPLVVLGRSSPWQQEVNHDFCNRQGIPVVRRCSGGQSIVTGPGCLMYAVLLDYRKRPELRMLDVAHHSIMSNMQTALGMLGIESIIEGTSDLTVDGKKVSGNSMRCKKNWMVYHGTMICELDIDLIAQCLGTPARQPDYRRQRTHGDFLAQLATTPEPLAAAIAKTWSTSGEFGISSQLMDLTDQLLQSKYLSRQWNQKV